MEGDLREGPSLEAVALCSFTPAQLLPNPGDPNHDNNRNLVGRVVVFRFFQLSRSRM